MTCKDSHFLIGLGIGSIFGALAYGFARSARNQSVHYRKNRGRRGIIPTLSLFFIIYL